MSGKEKDQDSRASAADKNDCSSNNNDNAPAFSWNVTANHNANATVTDKCRCFTLGEIMAQEELFKLKQLEMNNKLETKLRDGMTDKELQVYLESQQKNKIACKEEDRVGLGVEQSELKDGMTDKELEEYFECQARVNDQEEVLVVEKENKQQVVMPPLESIVPLKDGMTDEELAQYFTQLENQHHNQQSESVASCNPNTTEHGSSSNSSALKDGMTDVELAQYFTQHHHRQQFESVASSNTTEHDVPGSSDRSALKDGMTNKELAFYLLSGSPNYPTPNINNNPNPSKLKFERAAATSASISSAAVVNNSTQDNDVRHLSVEENDGDFDVKKIIEIGNNGNSSMSDFELSNNNPNPSKLKFESAAATSASISSAVVVDNSTHDNDAKLAALLQSEYDYEYNESLFSQERTLNQNSNSKVCVSLDNYRIVVGVKDDDGDVNIGNSELYYSGDSQEENHDEDDLNLYEFETDNTFANNVTHHHNYTCTQSKITKHNSNISSIRNTRVMKNFKNVDVGVLKSNNDFQLGNRAFNSLKQANAELSSRHMRLKEKKQKSTHDKVLDHKTEMILYKLNASGVIDGLTGLISTGKESHVFHAKPNYAVKVYKTTLNEFKSREQYIKGDYRFKNKLKGTNSTMKLIKIWAEKEYANLKKMIAADIPCPQPLVVKSNVLVMSFLGEKDKPSQPAMKIKSLCYDIDTYIGQKVWKRIFIQTMMGVYRLYNKCNLIHADLSEYNLLYYAKKVHFIDVGQSVVADHPHAYLFLYRDVQTVFRFFKHKGFPIKKDVYPIDLFKFITDSTLQYMDKPMKNVVEDLFIDFGQQHNDDNEEEEEEEEEEAAKGADADADADTNTTSTTAAATDVLEVQEDEDEYIMVNNPMDSTLNQYEMIPTSHGSDDQDTIKMLPLIATSSNENNDDDDEEGEEENRYENVDLPNDYSREFFVSFNAKTGVDIQDLKSIVAENECKYQEYLSKTQHLQNNESTSSGSSGN